MKLGLVLCCLLISSLASAATSSTKMPTVDSNAVSHTSSEDANTAPKVDSNSDMTATDVNVQESTTTGERVIKIKHPKAVQGLDTITTDKEYLYHLPLRDKTSGASYVVASFAVPDISSQTPAGTKITYSSIYGSSPVLGALGNYEWMPFKNYGSLGVIFESGVFNSKGHGVFADGSQALEGYSLFIIPLTAMLKYRFEYTRRQLLVPYVEGGVSYYGFAEVRDDGQFKFAGSYAVGGGGGLMWNLSRISSVQAYMMDSEMGVTDFWINMGARQMIGLKESLDMTSTVFMLGVTLDY